MLQKFIESDFEFLNIDNGRFSLLKRSLDIKSAIDLEVVDQASLYFLFSNVVNIDTFVLHRFMLVFWLLTGVIGKISNYKVALRLGIWYFSFKIALILRKNFFYRMLSFFFDDFLKTKFFKSVRFFDGNFVFTLPDLDILTNHKLARGVYFHRILEAMYLNIKGLKNGGSFFVSYLDSLKLIYVV